MALRNIKMRQRKKTQKQITNVIHKNKFVIKSMVGRTEVKKGCHFCFNNNNEVGMTLRFLVSYKQHQNA